MSDTPQIIDHAAAAVNRLVSQFQRPRIIAWLRALLEPTVAIEQAWYDLLTMRYLDTATGRLLDLIGKLVGQPRNGMSDDEVYRRFIRARIATNRSSGTGEQLLRIARLVINDPTAKIVVSSDGYATANVRILNVAILETTSDALIAMLNLAAGDGIRVIVEYTTLAPAGLFRFDSGPGFDVGRFASAKDE